jgi:hypothetical protein
VGTFLGDCALCGPNRVTAATLGNGDGDWNTNFQITNAGSDVLASVSRSATAADEDTTFAVDLGSARAIKLFALVNHNLSSAATIDIIAGSSAGSSSALNSTGNAAWSFTVEPALSSVGLEDDNLYDGSRFWCPIILPSFVTARHWTITIHDESNADGWVQFGRVHLSGAFIPPYGAEVGLKHPRRDLTASTQAISGAVWKTQRGIQRGCIVSMPGLSTTEGETGNHFQQMLGTSRPVGYVPSLSDRESTQRHGFYGYMSELSPVENIAMALRGFSVQMTEQMP